MNYYVFQISETKTKSAREYFDGLVVGHSVWGFKSKASYRNAIQAGDRVLFYLTGAENQVFVGAATLKSGAYEDKSGESKAWFDSPDILRIDLNDVVIFSDARSRRGLEWHPQMGAACRISEKEYLMILGNTPMRMGESVEAEAEMEFALEKYLEDFIVENWSKIDFGEKLTLYKDEDGNTGQQFYADPVGYIDLLAKDKNGDFVVIELKKGRKNDEVVGQVLRYIGWVRKNLLKKGQKVRGMIVVGQKDEKLEYAISEMADKVSVKLYKVSFKLENY